MKEIVEKRSHEERRRDLEELARRATLEASLTELVRCAEQALPEQRCSILLLAPDERTLMHGAGTSLPHFYTSAVDGLEIGPKVGSCGAAAYTGERVIVEDVQTHQNWEGYRDLAQRAEIRACWSEPIKGKDGSVLGTFAMYFSEPRAPRIYEIEFIETIAGIAAITLARHRSAEERRARQTRLRHLAQDDHTIYWVTDWETNSVLFVSPSYESIWGRSRQSLYDDPGSWTLAIPSEERERVYTAFRDDAAAGKYDIEYRILRPDGRSRWIRDRAFPIQDGSGVVRRIAGISEDVTLRREFENSLRDSEDSFRQLAENVGAVFWLTDWQARRMLYVSASWERIWGQSVECLFGEDSTAWADNIHEEDRERVLECFRRDAESGSYDQDFRVVHPDGTVRWLHERAFPIRNADGVVMRIAGVAEDITERKRVEHELQTARDEIDAMRRSQVESLTSELLLAEENERARLAQDLHDGMNQLITLALLKLVQLKDSTSGDTRVLAEEIESVIEKAGQSTRSLTYQLSPPILHDLGFEQALQWLVEDIEKSYGMEVELNEAEETSPLDRRVRVLLFRAVRELLINVAKHADARSARIDVRRTGDLLEISVEDDGVAFDPEVVGKRGIGLYGIRERLNHLGGEMIIDAQPRRGTNVTLRAPLSRLEEEPS
jgi:PAS domain S-box-containing protein